METTGDSVPVMVTEPSRGMASLHLALKDLKDALSIWPLWTFMARHDIRSRYNRSVLGPLWLIVSLVVQIGAIGVVWGALLKQEPRVFVPHITLGLIAWTLLRGILGDSCQCFVVANRYITQTRRPMATFVFQLVARNVLIFAHSLVVYLAVALLFQVPLGPAVLLAVPGTLLALLAVSWVPLLLGPLGARLRDLNQIAQSLLQVVFFVTPVMWSADMLGRRAFIASLNPLTHLLALVRDPLRGQMPEAVSWYIAIAIAVAGWAVAILVFARLRRRIPYWL